MKKAILFFLIFWKTGAHAQEIPLGGWQTHFSYLSALHVEQIQNRFFVATYNGLFSYEPEQDSTFLYSKINGLHDTGISSIAYNPAQQLLLLSYRNGNLDLMYLNDNGEPRDIVEWPLLRDATTLPADRRTGQITFRDNLAYLATSFGIVVLDPGRREVKESYRYIGKEGAEVTVTGIAFTTDSLYALTSQGILRTSMAATTNRQFYGNWQAVPTPFSATSIAVYQNALYAGKAGEGIFRRINSTWQIAYPATSARYTFRLVRDRLLASLDSRVVVLSPQDQVTGFRDALIVNPREAILDAANSIWIADARSGLVSNYEGSYRSYSPTTTDTTITTRSDSLLIDRNGNQWARLPLSLGGGILVKNASTQRYLTTSPNNGGLPSSQVNSLSLDRDGLIWFAADRGVGYFVPDGVLAGGNVNAVFPLFGQRRLLSTEFSTAIVTEPGNRKWVGTRNGLYLFNSDGTRLIRQFTAGNSPLPADQILALQFADAEGRLFVDTPKGMVSYRADATAPAPSLQSIMIFPNPVRPGYSGVVGIKGLVENTVVKITDLTGKLVYQTRSEGGTAAWNLLDYTGRRARGGVYLVLLTAADGTESLAGKLALVE